VNDYWVSNRTLGVGLLVGMIVLGLYVAKLVTRVFDSLHRAEPRTRPNADSSPR